jgi:MFS family permease
VRALVPLPLSGRRQLTMVFVMPIAGLLYNRLGVRAMVGVGLALRAEMLGRLNLDSGAAQIIIPQAVQGIGFAFMFVSLSTASLSTIPPALMQSATGLSNLARQLGGSLGTAMVVTLLDHQTTTASSRLMQYARPTIRRLSPGGSRSRLRSRRAASIPPRPRTRRWRSWTRSSTSRPACWRSTTSSSPSASYSSCACRSRC